MNETNPHAWKDPGVIWPDLYHPHVSQTKKLKSPMEQGLAQGEVVASPHQKTKTQISFPSNARWFPLQTLKAKASRSRWGLLLTLYWAHAVCQRGARCLHTSTRIIPREPGGRHFCYHFTAEELETQTTEAGERKLKREFESWFICPQEWYSQKRHPAPGWFGKECPRSGVGWAVCPMWGEKTQQGDSPLRTWPLTPGPWPLGAELGGGNT